MVDGIKTEVCATFLEDRSIHSKPLKYPHIRLCVIAPHRVKIQYNTLFSTRLALAVRICRSVPTLAQTLPSNLYTKKLATIASQNKMLAVFGIGTNLINTNH